MKNSHSTTGPRLLEIASPSQAGTHTARSRSSSTSAGSLLLRGGLTAGLPAGTTSEGKSKKACAGHTVPQLD